MFTYFVVIPSSSFPTAEIYAPDTKHARTTYLDFLSRNNYIQWSDRGEVRKRILTKRAKPGQFLPDTSLSYGKEGRTVSTNVQNFTPTISNSSRQVSPGRVPVVTVNRGIRVI